MTDPLSHTTTLIYDLGDVVSVTDPLSRVTQPFVGNAARLVSVADALGQVAHSQYDAANRITSVADPRQRDSISYDVNSNLLTVTDARRNVTTYVYNDMDRVTSRTVKLTAFVER